MGGVKGAGARAEATPRRRAPFVLDSDAKWRVASSPVRQRLIQLMEDERWWTVRELAHLLGRDPHALYHHLDEMRGVGMVEVGEDGGATTFRISGRVVAEGFRDGGPFLAHYRKTVERMMREAARIHTAPAAVAGEDTSGSFLAGVTLNLTQAQARALRQRIRALRDELHALQRQALEGEAPRQPFYVLLGLAPLEPDATDGEEAPAARPKVSRRRAARRA